RLALTVAGGRLSVTRASAKDPDATLRTDVPTLRELAFRKRRLDDAAAAGAAAVEGDRAVLQRLLDAF
ncbi:MAG TPA: alkyl sulfatase C-terminal domain-containing protein, partial [Solirubrobacteraceae bacterium]